MRSQAFVTVLLSLACFAFATYPADCPTVPSIADDRRSATNKASNTVTIAQFNAKFLFGVCAPGGDCPWDTLEKSTQHMLNVSNVIKAVNAGLCILAPFEFAPAFLTQHIPFMFCML
jgi:hypothetical protein